MRRDLFGKARRKPAHHLLEWARSARCSPSSSRMLHLPEGELQHEVSAPVPHAPDGYDRAAKPNPCKKLGDPCDFLPGKPGLCAAEKICTAENCLYCRLRE